MLDKSLASKIRRTGEDVTTSDVGMTMAMTSQWTGFKMDAQAPLAKAEAEAAAQQVRAR